MLILSVEENSFGYLGVFSKPALSLWSEGAKIFEGLLSAFSSYDVDLEDITINVLNQSPAGQMISVDLDLMGNYAFRFNRVEWAANDLTEEEITKFPEILQSGDDWLRSATNNLPMKTHVVTYSSHSKLSAGSVGEFLTGFKNQEITGIGRSLGMGFFYHWYVSELEGLMHLSIDHSDIVSDGLFIHAKVETNKDKIDFEQVVTMSRHKTEVALAQLGLEFERW